MKPNEKGEGVASERSKPKVYVETTVVSDATALPTNDLVLAGKRRLAAWMSEGTFFLQAARCRFPGYVRNVERVRGSGPTFQGYNLDQGLASTLDDPMLDP